MITRVTLNWWQKHEGADPVTLNVTIMDDALGAVHRDLVVSDKALCERRGSGADDWNTTELLAELAGRFKLAARAVKSREPEAADQ